MALQADIKALGLSGKAKVFYEQGAVLIEKNGAFKLEHGSPEWTAWDTYFFTLGWRPCVWKYADSNLRPLTMPTRWPWEFDAGYAKPGSEGNVVRLWSAPDDR